MTNMARWYEEPLAELPRQAPRRRSCRPSGIITVTNMQPDLPTAPPPAMPDAARILLQLQGTAWALRAGQPSLRLERKQAALLTLLWLKSGIARARVAELLWPQVEAKRARGNLRERLARLRDSLGDVVRDEQGLLTLAPGVHAQADAFEEGGLLGALDYTDCDDFLRWLNEQRDRQRAAHQVKALAQVREAARQGELDRAEQLAQGLLALDRESEEAYRVLMEVYYLRGDYAAAIAVWDRCREMLRELYDVLPSEATRRLGEQLMRAARDPQPRPLAVGMNLPLTVCRRAGVPMAWPASVAWRASARAACWPSSAAGRARCC
jgi:DNA-binding SARP family transcriptional activator